MVRRRHKQRQHPEPESRPTAELWRYSDVADFLGVTDVTIRTWIRDENLPYRRIGRMVYFIPDEIRAWVAQKRPAA